VLKGSQLWRLTPFVDNVGILRVGGRLESNLPYTAKNPVFLPKKHHISKLVVGHIHDQGHHSLGVNATLAELRQWSGLSKGEKKSSDGNQKVMFVNSKESAEESKSWQLHLNSDLDIRCDVSLVVESISLAPLLSS